MKTNFQLVLRRIISYRKRLFQFLLLLAVVSLEPGCEESLEVKRVFDAVSAGVARDNTTSTENIPSFPSDPSAFVDEITNPYLAFERGKIFHYEAETDEGTETIIVEVTNHNKRILGVATTVVHDQVFLNGDLIEDTFDWFAQDNNGNVWYFGEDSKEIDDGEVVSTEGSWKAGVNGARPGLIMLADPENGLKYQQEFAEGVAEDMAQIVSTDKTVETGLGIFEECLKTMEFTPLEPGHREYKFYHPGTGLILETSSSGGPNRVELISVTD